MSREPPPSQRLERMVGEMQAAGMSLRDIAREAQLSHSTIWHASIGMAREPSYQTFVKIEDVYTHRCGLPPKR